MKNFNWNDFCMGEICVYCTTREIAENFLMKAEQRGFKPLFSDQTFVEYGLNLWEIYKEKTCFYGYTKNKYLTYSNLKSAYRYGYTVVEWGNEIFSVNLLESGDFVELKNGNVLMYLKEKGGFISETINISKNKYNFDLSHKNSKIYDIMTVFRPTNINHCNFTLYRLGEKIFERESDKSILRLILNDKYLMGDIGTPTVLKDSNSELLFVGDQVRIINKFMDMDFGVAVVCNNNDYRDFISGIANDSSSKRHKGEIVSDWKIVKCGSYTELKVGDEIGYLKVEKFVQGD